jgi:hypothetical protein
VGGSCIIVCTTTYYSPIEEKAQASPISRIWLQLPDQTAQYQDTYAATALGLFCMAAVTDLSAAQPALLVEPVALDEVKEATTV